MGCSKSKSIEEIEKIEKIEEINNNKSEPNELMKSMDEYRVFLDRDDIRKFDKTYKNLGYFWEKIQNQLIYLWDVDERGETK